MNTVRAVHRPGIQLVQYIRYIAAEKPAEKGSLFKHSDVVVVQNIEGVSREIHMNEENRRPIHR
jgi:hypothetical protein